MCTCSLDFPDPGMHLLPYPKPFMARPMILNLRLSAPGDQLPGDFCDPTKSSVDPEAGRLSFAVKLPANPARQSRSTAWAGLKDMWKSRGKRCAGLPGFLYEVPVLSESLDVMDVLLNTGLKNSLGSSEGSQRERRGRGDKAARKDSHATRQYVERIPTEFAMP